MTGRKSQYEIVSRNELSRRVENQIWSCSYQFIHCCVSFFNLPITLAATNSAGFRGCFSIPQYIPCKRELKLAESRAPHCL